MQILFSSTSLIFSGLSEPIFDKKEFVSAAHAVMKQVWPEKYTLQQTRHFAKVLESVLPLAGITSPGPTREANGTVWFTKETFLAPGVGERSREYLADLITALMFSIDVVNPVFAPHNINLSEG